MQREKTFVTGALRADMISFYGNAKDFFRKGQDEGPLRRAGRLSGALEEAKERQLHKKRDF